MRNFQRRATIGLDIDSNAFVANGAEINVAGINFTTVSDLLIGSNELDNGGGFNENDTLIVNRARITTLPNLNSFGANLCFPTHLIVGMGGPNIQHSERLTITIENLGEWADVGMPIPNRDLSKFVTLSSDNAKIYCGSSIPAFLVGVELILNFELDVTYNKATV